MNPNLTTPYMTGEIERSMLESKAAKARLIDEALASTPRNSLTMKLRHQLAGLLMRAGERLDGRTTTMVPAGLEETMRAAE